MNKPQHTHDCDRCQYLGSENDLDFYFCESSILGTIIARYGSDGPDYSSSDVASVERMLAHGMSDVDGKHMPPEHETIQNLPIVRALKAYRESLKP